MTLPYIVFTIQQRSGRINNYIRLYAPDYIYIYIVSVCVLMSVAVRYSQYESCLHSFVAMALAH